MSVALMLGAIIKSLKLLIYISLLCAFTLCCGTVNDQSDNNQLKSNETKLKSLETEKVDQNKMETLFKDSIITKSDEAEEIDVLPIHGILNRENLFRYYPGVTDTFTDLRITASEKIELNPGDGIIVSMFHNGGAFDQMFICTHDSTLKLIDYLYIGKARDFDKSSHTINYKIRSANSLEFDQVDWGFVKKDEELEIDTEVV